MAREGRRLSTVHVLVDSGNSSKVFLAIEVIEMKNEIKCRHLLRRAPGMGWLQELDHNPCLAKTWAAFLASNTNEMKGRPGLFPKLVALQRTVKEAGTLGRCPVASFPHTYLRYRARP
ncbi:hypothetical protein NOF04DRAFT_1352075 [Fusarium oxysporum II5]|nr:hypothetical protein NOF04DRAFT_1352075 [Fusarium oxysporum II5]